jgi:outer membrane protein insertion porin family
MSLNKAAQLLLLTLLVLIATSRVSAQAYKVTTVEVEGNRTVETSLITSVAGLQPGTTLSSTSAQQAIHQIYALGLFSDVSVDGELAGGGIRLKIKVKEYPKIKSLNVEGNKHVKFDEIRTKLAVFENQPAGTHRVQVSCDAIKNIYRKEGYYLAEVTPEMTPLDSNSVSLVLKVKENEKVKIRSIQFTGNTVFADGVLAGEMKSKPGGFLRSGSFKQDQFDEDKEKLVEFYNKKGYLDAAVTGDSIGVDPDGKGLVITISVTEGNRYYFGDVSFSGNEKFKNEALLKQLKFKKGDVYNSEKFDESVTNLYTVYQDEGYIHARIIDNPQTVDSLRQITFDISEGMPAHINKVLIEGNTKTNEKVIRRELFSCPGDIFRRSVLMRSMRNVMVLNYFNPEKTTPDVKYLPNGDIDLQIKVEEKPTGQVQAGAGYSAQDKLVGTLGLGIPNFRGNGQSVNLDWAFGSRKTSVSLSFTEPWMFDRPTSMGFDLFDVTRVLTYSDEEFSEESRGMGVHIGRRLRWPDDYFRISGRYTLEKIRYFDFNDVYRTRYASSTNSLLDYENKWQTTSVVGATLSRDSRDLSQFATSGSLITLTSEFSGGPLGGDWLYHKHVFDVAKYTRVFWKLVLATKARLGVVDSPDGDTKIPYTERFAPGGTSTDGIIRGYEEYTVGPKNPSGAYLRGRSELVYNLELQAPIVSQQIYALVFADAGNSWLSGRQVKPFDFDKYDGLRKSVGAGFRVNIPGIGTIGFDFGYGYNRPDKAKWKPHFQFGATF